MTDIFKTEQGKVDASTSDWVGPAMCPDEARRPDLPTMPGLCKHDNFVRHVDRPRKGYDYSY